MKKGFVFLFTLNCILVLNSYSQEYNTDWECGCQPDTVLTKELGNSITYKDTSLKVGILLVQFADWETNWNARGGVGYNRFDTLTADTIYNKYRWNHIWDMYFSMGTYYDPLEPDPPFIHPDAGSHQIRVQGSFTDYWWEVSHKNLRILPAETHPAYGGNYRTGIINNVDTATGVIRWVTLDSTVDSYYKQYPGSGVYGIYRMNALIKDGLTKAHSLYNNQNVPDSIRLS